MGLTFHTIFLKEILWFGMLTFRTRGIWVHRGTLPLRRRSRRRRSRRCRSRRRRPGRRRPGGWRWDGFLTSCCFTQDAVLNTKLQKTVPVEKIHGLKYRGLSSIIDCNLVLGDAVQSRRGKRRNWQRWRESATATKVLGDSLTKGYGRSKTRPWRRSARKRKEMMTTMANEGLWKSHDMGNYSGFASRWHVLFCFRSLTSNLSLQRCRFNVTHFVALLHSVMHRTEPCSLM